MGERPNVLVTGSFARGRLEPLLPYSRLHWLKDLDEKELDRLIPSVDCLLVEAWWPDSLTPERVSRMTRLRFIQSGMAGVNHIPFKSIGRRVTVSSNAGGFSVGVAEFAMALLLAAAKMVVKLDHSLRTGEFDASSVGALFREVRPLRAKTLGVLGYGGIGREVASMGKAFGMNAIAFSRHRGRDENVDVHLGRRGLMHVLGESDVVVIALPLSKHTMRLVGREELEVMRPDAILVNVARAEIVDEQAIYKHLVKNRGFTYATDVWTMANGRETYASRFPLLKLQNFIGTPHVAGGSAAVTGEPGRASAENLLRYLRGEAPQNVVDRSEYV